MTFLSDEGINKRLDELFEKAYHFETNEKGRPRNLQSSSFELRLGDEVFLSGEKKLERLDQNQSHVSIKPGDFAILLSHESVRIPKDLMALISIKTTYKNMGLVNISGFHVDPGYKGKLTFSVYNAGPGEIILRYLDPIFVIFFAKLGIENGEDCKEPYDGAHQGQKTISSGAMNQLTGKPVSPFDLDTRLRRLEDKSTIQWSLLVAIMLGVLTVVIRAMLG